MLLKTHIAVLMVVPWQQNCLSWSLLPIPRFAPILNPTQKEISSDLNHELFGKELKFYLNWYVAKTKILQKI